MRLTLFALLFRVVTSRSLRVGRTTLIGKATRSTTEYLGIPFARTEQRWGLPSDVDLTSLGDTIDATAFGPCCPQVEAVHAPNQVEACLSLNVFTTSAPDPSAPLLAGAPVMLFIHGGGGTTGCSAQAEPPLYNGTNVLRRLSEPAVVVSVNYRLSVLANLYLEGATPDNLQVRDWTSALRWVQRHIHAFGGDPTRVLLFGESAGGNAVQALALAPSAAGLFHHFLSESGTFALAAGYQNRSAADAQSRAVAASLGCSQHAAADVLACLREQTVDEIQAAAGMAQLGSVVGAEMVPLYPPWSLDSGVGISASLRTMTAGWNTPDNFNLCASAEGREAGPEEAAAYLAQLVPLWASATPSDVAAVLAAYAVSECVPAVSVGLAGGVACCALADDILMDATMRCTAHRSLAAYATHRPDAQQHMYSLDCCPTCPAPAGGLTCVCQHTSELAYVFGTVSSYESANAAPLNCTPEPTFRPFSDALIRTWAGIAANGSHGPFWPELGAGRRRTEMMVLLDQKALGGPAFTPQAWDTQAHNCELWRSIDDSAATVKFGARPVI